MFTKVPPRMFKGFFFIAWISLVLLVSCTTAVNSLAMSQLAAGSLGSGTGGGQLPPDVSPPVLSFPEIPLEELWDPRQQNPPEEEIEPEVQPEGEEEELKEEPLEKVKTPASGKSQTGEKPGSSSSTKPAAAQPAPPPETQPAAQPAPEPAPEPKPEPTPEPKPEPAPAPAPKYVWGTAKTVHFRTEVEATNTGSETATGVSIGIPLLESNSPYQTTTRTGTNYAIDRQSGQTAFFLVGDLEPGESKTVVIDYSITIRPVSVSGSNETMEKARIAYDKYAGSGNCLTLARNFVNYADTLGVKARLVIGYKRRGGGDITPGSLSGARHAWAEFHVEGLGWVPVDLTHQYFARIPAASHVVETYGGNYFVQIKYSGGSVSTQWRNMIM